MKSEKQQNSNNTSGLNQDHSPAVTSSRYSNSNTACTRNLFTPSEDNCLSQHLTNYSSKQKSGKPTAENEGVFSSQIGVFQNMNAVCNTVLEEKSKEDTNTEESMFTMRSPEKSPQKLMLIDNQAERDSSILLLEDAVDTLIREQQSLKKKLSDQEKLISNLSNQNSDKNTEIQVSGSVLTLLANVQPIKTC